MLRDRVTRARLREAQLLESLKDIAAINLSPLPLEVDNYGAGLVLDVPPASLRLDHYLGMPGLTHQERRTVVLDIAQALAAAQDRGIALRTQRRRLPGLGICR